MPIFIPVLLSLNIFIFWLSEKRFFKWPYAIPAIASAPFIGCTIFAYCYFMAMDWLGTGMVGLGDDYPNPFTLLKEISLLLISEYWYVVGIGILASSALYLFARNGMKKIVN